MPWHPEACFGFSAATLPALPFTKVHSLCAVPADRVKVASDKTSKGCLPCKRIAGHIHAHVADRCNPHEKETLERRRVSFPQWPRSPLLEVLDSAGGAVRDRHSP